ncbi:MAG: ATP-binding protein, partial [Blastocatellia bacterium]|nr:ATP-binding protein [Blastocatellia bacterium]
RMVGTDTDITIHKQAEELLKAHARQQAAVALLGQHALAGSGLGALMDEAVTTIARTLDVEYCKVLELLPGGGSLLLRAGVGWKEGLVGRAIVEAGLDSQAGFTLISNEPVIVEDLATETRFGGPSLLREHEVVSGISVIIHGQTAPLGVLGAHTSRRRTFTRDDINFLQAVANVLAAAIERRQTEEALREAEARYHSIIENAAYGIYISTPDGRFIEANAAMVAMLGYESSDDLRSLDLAKDLYCDPDERARLIEQFKQSKAVEEVEVDWRRKDGSIITVRLSGRTIKDAQGNPEGFEVIAENVTERRLLEEQLRQSQKMEAIGRLAGGIAHDFNNLLTAILGYDQLAMSRLEPDSPMRQELEEIMNAGQRAASLTSQLLAFSRKQMLQPKVLNLNTVIEKSSRMLKRLIGEDIELTAIQAPSLGRVKVDPAQIEQVIMNLALNARDAMAEGGKLIIETANAYLDEDYARSHIEVQPGHYVMIGVTDTGAGMDQETLSHIFEPFFTTKEQGKGTGLGLSIIYGIIRQSGGHLWAHSEEGKGATFKIYLPRVDDPDEAISSQTLSAEMPRGKETILVVEDEEMVRRLVSQTLEECGYAVLSACGGSEAALICRQQEKPIDLIVTDMVMPQMSGRELIERIAPLYPEIKVLYISGYTGKAIFHNSQPESGTGYLEKPFSPLSLARKVREVLDR